MRGSTAISWIVGVCCGALALVLVAASTPNQMVGDDDREWTHKIFNDHLDLDWTTDAVAWEIHDLESCPILTIRFDSETTRITLDVTPCEGQTENDALDELAPIFFEQWIQPLVDDYIAEHCGDDKENQ